MNEGEDKQPLLFEVEPPRRCKLRIERSRVLIRKATPEEVETHNEYVQRLRRGRLNPSRAEERSESCKASPLTSTTANTSKEKKRRFALPFPSPMEIVDELS